MKAGALESELHSWGGGVTAKYKARFRTLSFNLKDANNPDLRRRVLSGEIVPEVRRCSCCRVEIDFALARCHSGDAELVSEGSYIAFRVCWLLDSASPCFGTVNTCGMLLHSLAGAG